MSTEGIFPAAQYCYDLDEGGYNDWFLPAKDQLEQASQTNWASTYFGGTTYYSSSQNINGGPRSIYLLLNNSITWSSGGSVIAPYVFKVRCMR